MKTIVDRLVRWGRGVSMGLLVASTAIAQDGPPKAAGDPILQRHWNPAFDVRLPDGVGSDDENLKRRCWSQQALDTYVTEGRFWIEDLYGLPYGYVQDHCLKEQLAKIDTALNDTYRVLLRTLEPAERRKVVASERRWLSRRTVACNVPDGRTFVMLGSFVCLMNMTNDRIDWIGARQSSRKDVRR